MWRGASDGRWSGGGRRLIKGGHGGGAGGAVSGGGQQSVLGKGGCREGGALPAARRRVVCQAGLLLTASCVIPTGPQPLLGGSHARALMTVGTF